MQKLTILICGRAAGDVQARRKDITAWLQSLTPGKGKLNTEARTEQQTSYKSDCRVSVPAPKGFYTELHEGEGFHDATYARLGKRNAPVEQFSVQVGDHPQLRVKELLASQQQTQSGTMAEQKAEWHLFEEAELLFAECVLPPRPPREQADFLRLVVALGEKTGNHLPAHHHHHPRGGCPHSADSPSGAHHTQPGTGKSLNHLIPESGMQKWLKWLVPAVMAFFLLSTALFNTGIVMLAHHSSWPCMSRMPRCI